MKKHISLFVSFIVFPFLPVAALHLLRMNSNNASMIDAAKHGLVVLGTSVLVQYTVAYMFSTVFGNIFYRKPIYTALFGILSAAIACLSLFVIFSPAINNRAFPAVIMFGAFSGVLAYHVQAKLNT